MPKYQSPRKKRALSHRGDNYSDSEDDFEDEKDDDFSFEENDDDMIIEEEDDVMPSLSDDEIPKTVRRSRRSAKRFLSKLHLSDDEDSDQNMILPDLEEEEQPKTNDIQNNSILVTYREDYMQALRCSQIIYHLELPINSWIPILEKMNTFYVKGGSILNPTRLSEWKEFSPEKQQTSIELFLIKWRNLSYLHCSWESNEDLVKKEGSHMKQKMQRFYRSENEAIAESQVYGIDVYFNPEFTEVDRVLDVRIIQEDTEQPLTVSNNSDLDELLIEEEYGRKGMFMKEYLIKWKGLAYCDISWECYDDFQNQECILEYYNHLKRDISKNILDVGDRPSVSHYTKITDKMEFKGNNQLRSYQADGINWLLWNWVNGRNSILADEMGLGKTVQSTMFMFNILYQYMVKPPFLVVAPLSTIPHWEAEIRRWTDMHVVVLHGNVKSRENIFKYEWRSKNGEFDVLITTYEIALVEATRLSSISWTGIVVDEAHRLKGKNNKLGDVLRKIDFGCKLLLTGTPLQNNTEELWSLLNFLQPEKFDDADQFQTEFGDMKNSTQLEKLQSVLKPYMLRRMKEDVEKSLKPKEETVINVELTALQKKFYRAVYDHNTSVFIGTETKNLPSLMNIMMELRKCCNHPFLIRGVEATVIEDSYKNENQDKPQQCPQSIQELPSEKSLKLLLNTSGKMVLLDKLLPKLKSQGHKVLLFSQMVRMLDLIQDYLVLKGYAFERIDGQVKVADRQAAIERFSTPNSDRFIFLICTRAGGFGINLTAADTVIIYDSDWNPQNDIQAQARCHRIGQDKAVKVYRLITNRTYEMEMFQRANLKLGLDKAVLNPLKQSITSDGRVSEVPKMTKKDAETLLKYGAYDFFKEEREGKTEELSNAFCEADIDQILEKNTKVITIDSQGGSSFSKASFITDTSAEVDINDPDFWTKVVGLKEHQQEDIGPRHRRKIDYHSVEEDDTKTGNEAIFEDEGDWIKTDRDTLLRLLLSFGWGYWEPIYNHERMQRHSRTSIRILSSAIIGQLARITQIIEEDGDFKKMQVTAVKSAQQGREAILALESTYPICQVLKQSNEDAEAGKEAGVAFPHRYPDLVRDTAWLHKMVRVCTRYLKHLSFLYHLHKDVKIFQISVGASVTIPKPKRAVSPANWWGNEEDRDCILGTEIHGWGNWRAICDDPQLCFKQKGVIYNNQVNEEEESLIEGDNEQEPVENETSPVSPIPDHAKIFPPTSLLMKRIRRLVDTMEALVSRGIQESQIDLPTTPSTPKRVKKTSAIFLGNWAIKESKSLRNAILQWGLPLPPCQLRDDQLFAMNRVPLYLEVKEQEKEHAIICDVVESLIQQVSIMLKPQSSSYLSFSLSQLQQSARQLATSYHYHNCPLCHKKHAPSNIPSYCIYCDCYVGYRILRISGGLLNKSYEDVQFLARYIEENAAKLADVPPRPGSRSMLLSDDLKMEDSSKHSSEVETIIPSSVLAQRIYSRLQLYYDLQQLVWKKEPKLLKVFLQHWASSGVHQDNSSKNWKTGIHDAYLFEGLYKWGVVEWEVLWKDPSLPFYVDEVEEARRKKTRKRSKRGKKGETLDENGEPSELTELPVATEGSDLILSKEELAMKEKAIEEALKTKVPSIKREDIVPGLPSLYVLKRINTILRFFKQFNSYTVVSAYNQPPLDVGLVVRNESRHVGIIWNHNHYTTKATVMLEEEVFWKKNQCINNNALYPIRHTHDLAYLSAYSTRSLDNWKSIKPDGDKLYPQSQYPYVIPAGFYSSAKSSLSSTSLQSQPINYPSTVAVRPGMRDINRKYFIESRKFREAINLPFKIQNVTIYSLGYVNVRCNTYHNDKYIWPIGFKSGRMYTSFKNPSIEVEYISEILDGGTNGPSFKVTASDAQESPFISNSATQCWKQVMDAVKTAKSKDGTIKNTVSISGPEYFGYSYPEVAYLIEGLSCADMCKNYVCRKIRDNNRMMNAAIKNEIPTSDKNENSVIVNSSLSIKREAPSNDIMYNDKRLKQ